MKLVFNNSYGYVFTLHRFRIRKRTYLIRFQSLALWWYSCTALESSFHASLQHEFWNVSIDETSTLLHKLSCLKFETFHSLFLKKDFFEIFKSKRKNPLRNVWAHSEFLCLYGSFDLYCIAHVKVAFMLNFVIFSLFAISCIDFSQRQNLSSNKTSKCHEFPINQCTLNGFKKASSSTS